MEVGRQVQAKDDESSQRRLAREERKTRGDLEEKPNGEKRTAEEREISNAATKS